jgi:hypothetical protein
MALTQFTTLDFDQIKQSIRDYLRANSNFTDYDFEGSNFSILIDILAYNTYITAYNTNAVVNEAFLDSALIRQNVVSLARNIGYVPKSKKAARMRVTILVVLPDGTNPQVLRLKAGLVATATTNEVSYVFSIPEDITVNVVNGLASFNNIEIYEGTYALSTFIVDTSQSSQNYIIDNVGVDISTLSVRVSPNQQTVAYDSYNQINSIVGVTTSSNVYLVQEVANEKYQLIFGDGIISKKLNNNNYIQASYIITNGTLGNGVRSASFNGIIVDGTEEIVTGATISMTIDSPSKDGADIESINSIKYYAPRRYASQGRAVSSQDFETIVPEIYPNTESIIAYGGEELDPPQYGKVFLVIKPKSGDTLSQFTKDSILRQLKSYTIAGIVPQIIDMKYLYVELTSSIYYNPSFTTSSDVLKNNVIDCLNTYVLEGESVGFNGRVKYSKIVGLIDDVSMAITSNITKIKIRRNLIAQIGAVAQYEICYGNKFHKKEGGYSIKSTGFNISSSVKTVYLSDIPNLSNDRLGNIIFFELDSQNNPIIINNNAGTVDYLTGEIRIDNVIITSTDLSDNIIEIEAIPESNDIVGLKDLYLKVDISKSSFEMINDTISSGANQSGTTFVSTSSYSNGKYTR